MRPLVLASILSCTLSASAQTVAPAVPDTYDLGAPYTRWRSIYADWANIHRTTSDGTEQSAIAAMSSTTQPDKFAVGGIFRAAYLAGSGGTAFGLATEAWADPGADANVVGAEFSVRSHAGNQREMRGIDVVFKDRPDGTPAVSLGDNRYNEHSAAVYISSQPRSASGEYAGWNAGIKFDASSLDRTASVPYAAAIDLTQLAARADTYFVVWSCPPQKCGLVLGVDGSVTVKKF
jgi:hypothetical protein